MREQLGRVVPTTGLRSDDAGVEVAARDGNPPPTSARVRVSVRSSGCGRDDASGGYGNA
jgi:hypothetical protein